MKIALAQIDVIPGDPEKNFTNMKKYIAQAKEQNCEIISFSEMVVGGYLLGDKWLNDDYCRWLMSYNDKIAELSDNIGIIYGNVHLDDDLDERLKKIHFTNNWHPNKDGRIRRYNAAYFYYNGKPVEKTFKIPPYIPEGIQIKTLLPNYRMFDDERYFFSIKDVARDFSEPLDFFYAPFIFKGRKIALEVCEDLWANDYRESGYPLSPTRKLVANGAEVIINISASPWTYGKNNARDRRIVEVQNDVNGADYKPVPFIYVNCVGVQNNGKNFITFDGGSTVYNSDGRPVIINKNKPYEEELITFELEEVDKLPIANRDLGDKIEQKAQAIIRAIQTFNCPIIIGLSGGLDSSVVAGLCVLAKRKVIGVNMPSRYNSANTKYVAKEVANNLGISYMIINIEDMVEANKKALRDSGVMTSLLEENLQAKIRGISILSNLAQMYNGIFTNNGNKNEVLLGYFTLGGDGEGAISVIGDLTKTEVVEMGRYINKVFNKTIIPEQLFPGELFTFPGDKITPSAELKENQKDPILFGYNCAIIEALMDYNKRSPEDIMQWWLEGRLAQILNIDEGYIKRYGLDAPGVFLNDLEWVYRQMEGSVFKRVQSPPIVITSKTAFGYDLRESMLPFIKSEKYKELEEKIKNKKNYYDDKI